MDAIFEIVRIYLEDVPAKDVPEIAQVISWGLVVYAVYRFLRSSYNVAFNQTPWAKKMQMSAPMVKRLDFTIMVNTLLLLYIAVTAVLGAPVENYVLDAAIQTAFALWLATLFDWNWSDQAIKGDLSGPPPARRKYLLRLYRERGLTIVGLVLIPVGITAKYLALTAAEWNVAGGQLVDLLSRFASW